MKTFRAPQSDLTVSSIVLGLMRIAKMSDADIRALFDAALECGVTMIDHADVYGGAPHVCEARFGEPLSVEYLEGFLALAHEKRLLEGVGAPTSSSAGRLDFERFLFWKWPLIDPDALLAPASVTKLFSCAAALVALGPDSTFETTVLTALPQ